MTREMIIEKYYALDVHYRFPLYLSAPSFGFTCIYLVCCMGTATSLLNFLEFILATHESVLAHEEVA